MLRSCAQHHHHHHHHHHHQLHGTTSARVQALPPAPSALLAVPMCPCLLLTAPQLHHPGLCLLLSTGHPSSSSCSSSSLGTHLQPLVLDELLASGCSLSQPCCSLQHLHHLLWAPAAPPGLRAPMVSGCTAQHCVNTPGTGHDARGHVGARERVVGLLVLMLLWSESHSPSRHLHPVPQVPLPCGGSMAWPQHPHVSPHVPCSPCSLTALPRPPVPPDPLEPALRGHHRMGSPWRGTARPRCHSGVCVCMGALR